MLRRINRRILTLSIALALAWPLLPSAPVARGETFATPDHRVDDSTTDTTNQTDPSIAVAGATVYIAYVDASADAGDIYLARSDDGGATFPIRVRVDDDTTAARQANPAAAVDGNGTVYVVWEDYRLHTTDAEIAFSASFDGGLTWGDGLPDNDTILNSDLTPLDLQRDPAVVAWGMGNVAVAWMDNRRAHPDIYFAASNSSGASWGANLLVNDDTGNAPQQEPALAVNATGSLYAAWRDRRKGGEEIYFGRSDDGGATWTANVQVNDDTGNVLQDRPAIAVDGGTVYLAWHDLRAAGDAIYSSRSTNAGATWGDGVQNNNDVRLSDGAGPTATPALAVSNGTVHAVWRDSRRGQDDIYHSSSLDGAQSWGDGLVNDNDARVNDDPAGSVATQGNGALAATANGVCAAWGDDRDGNPDILLSCFTAAWGNGRVDDRDVVAAGWGTPAAGTQQRPRLAVTAGILHAVWEDNRSGDFGIYHSWSLDGGAVWGDGLPNSNDRRVDDAMAGDQDRPVLGLSLAGALGVAWRDTRLGDADIFFAASPDGGDTWGNGEIDDSDARVNDDNGTAAQDRPAVTALANGTWIVAWEDYRNGDADVFLSFSTDGGFTWAPNVRVDDDSGSANQTRPAVTADAAGTLHIAYADDRSGDSNIRYVSCMLDGTAVPCGDGVPDTDVRVNDDSGTANQTAPAVAVALGRIVIAWEDSRGGTPDVHASASADGGVTWGDGAPDTDPRVHASTSGDQGAVSLAGDAGGVYAGWTDTTAGAVWTARSDDAATWGFESEPSDPAFSAATQARAHLGLNFTTLFAAWDDDRGGDPDVYFASAPRGGSPPPPTLLLIVLTPGGPLTLVPAQTVTFTALGYDTDGSQNLTWTPAWNTTDARGTLTNLGGSAAAGYTADYTAGAVEGDDNVTVASGAVTAATALTIVNISLPLDRIDLAPTAASLQVGGSVSFTALGYDSAGRLNTTWTPAWGVPTLGSLGPFGGNATAGYTATYTAGNASGADIVTVANGTVSASADVTILPGDLALVTIDPWPGPVPVSPGGLVSFIAFGYDTLGNLNTSWAATWTAGPLGSVATTGGTAATGYVASYRAGLSGGMDWMRVASGAVQNETAVDIRALPLSRIELLPWPGPVPLLTGGTLDLVASGFDAAGNRNLTWTPTWSLVGSGAFVMTGGSAAAGFTARYRAAAPGLDTISVSSSGVFNNTLVLVSSPAIARVSLVPSPAVEMQVAEFRGFLALAYDATDNLVTAWTPVWSTTNLLGNVTATGGSGATGFTATFEAGLGPGTSGLTVSPAGVPAVSNTTTITISPGPLDGIDVTPPGPVGLLLGDRITFTATAFDAYGNRNLSWTPMWISLNGRGTLGNFGGSAAAGWTAEYTATGVGDDVLRVLSGGVFADVAITTTALPGPLDRIEVLPSPLAQVAAGGTLTLRAFGYDAYGNRNTSWIPSWSQLGGHGTLGGFGGTAATGYTAVYSAGTGEGFDVVLVASGTVSGLTTVEVVGGPLASIALEPWPGPLILNPGTVQTFTARGYDAFGNLNGSWTPAWSSTDALGTVVPGGTDGSGGFLASYLAGPAEGMDNVTVTSGGAFNETSVLILDTGPLAVIELTPPTATLGIGEPVILTARGFDAVGRQNTSWNLLSTQWSVTGGIGSLSGFDEPVAGVFTATFTADALGNATVTVSFAGLLNSSQVGVVDRDPPATAVRALPAYATGPSLDLALDLTDAGGSGLALFEVWAQWNDDAFLKIGEYTAAPVPYTFPGDGRFAFYSIGVDGAGNREAVPADPDAVTVRDTRAPRLAAVSPPDGGSAAGPFHLLVVFDEPVVPGSVRLAILAGDDAWDEADGNVTWRDDRTLIFDGDFEVPAGTVTVRVSGATDPAGNVLPETYEWSFRGGAAAAAGSDASLLLLALLLLAVATILVLLLLIRKKRKEEEQRLEAARQEAARKVLKGKRPPPKPPAPKPVPPPPAEKPPEKLAAPPEPPKPIEPAKPAEPEKPAAPPPEAKPPEETKPTEEPKAETPETLSDNGIPPPDDLAPEPAKKPEPAEKKPEPREDMKED